MKEIYLVNTTIDPAFFKKDLLLRTPQKAYLEHNEFVRRTKQEVPRFGTSPYIALMSDGNMRVAIDPPEFTLSGVVEGDVVSAGTLKMKLDEFIDAAVEGRADVPSAVNPNAIVEFSAEELYPEVIRRLSQKYHISKVRVE